MVTRPCSVDQQIVKAADMLRLAQSGVLNPGCIAASRVSDKEPQPEAAQFAGPRRAAEIWE